MILAFNLIASVWVWFIFGMLPALALCLLASLIISFRSPKLSVWMLILGAVVLFKLERQITHPLPRVFQHEEVNLTVCINEPVRIFEDDWATFEAEVHKQPITLALRRIKASYVPSKFSKTISVGDCIEGRFRVRQPLGRIIPGTYNADRSLFANHIDARSTLISINKSYSRVSPSIALYKSKQNLFESSDGRDLWAALILGWSSSISSDTKTKLVENQVIHLFVISGMHLGFIAGFLAVFLRLINKWCSRYFIVSMRMQGVLIVILTMVYVAILGFPLAAFRAWLALLVPVIAIYSGVRIKLSSHLWFVAIVQTLIFPEGWLSLGPWLTYWALVVIFIIHRWQVLSSLNVVGKFLVFQTILSLSVIPWAFLLGLPINALSIVSNSILALVVGFVMMPIAIALSLIDSTLLMKVWEFFVDYALFGLEYSQVLSVKLPYFPIAIVLSAGCALVYFLWDRSRVSFALFLIALTVGIFSVLFSEREVNDYRLKVLDVGHGQALLMESPRGSMLYDTGGYFNPNVSLYESTLHRVIPSLDAVVISHSDSDHAAGYDYIRKTYPNIPIFSGQPESHSDSHSLFNCHTWKGWGASFRFIPIPKVLRTTDNDSSCVVLFQTKDQTALITGDVSKRVEYYLMQEYPDLFPADLILLGHHGSKTSSAVDWLELHRDSVFVVSTGDRAAPRWPATNILQWFEENEKALLSTANLGSLEFQFSESNIHVKTWDSAYRNRLMH